MPSFNDLYVHRKPANWDTYKYYKVTFLKGVSEYKLYCDQWMIIHFMFLSELFGDLLCLLNISFPILRGIPTKRCILQ